MKFIYKQDKTEELYHHGVKGQEWGVKHGPPYPLDRATHNRVVSGKDSGRKTKGKPKDEPVLSTGYRFSDYKVVKGSKPSFIRKHIDNFKDKKEKESNKRKLDEELELGIDLRENPDLTKTYFGNVYSGESLYDELGQDLNAYYNSKYGDKQLYNRFRKKQEEDFLDDYELANLVYDERPKQIKDKEKEMNACFDRAFDYFEKDVRKLTDKYKDTSLPESVTKNGVEKYIRKNLGLENSWIRYIQGHYEDEVVLNNRALDDLVDDYKEWRSLNKLRNWDEEPSPRYTLQGQSWGVRNNKR